ncbi:hypothetical protein ZHAS_00014732 [Anopheles sinensis]|uniref:Uncharacterized protein n=1 Tax=Anopheles sinensis TaxID=74873 RepID=A0A084W937_ANOSI|nr:hypothetical protein ZHAS_00014732 [Anopheles sinensis]
MNVVVNPITSPSTIGTDVSIIFGCASGNINTGFIEVNLHTQRAAVIPQFQLATELFGTPKCIH